MFFVLKLIIIIIIIIIIIERLHSREQYLCKFMGTKEIF